MNILTFDIEDWFHLLDNESTKSVAQWEMYPSRIHSNVEKILELLDDCDQKATFFCLGWMIQKYPEVIKLIVKEGYEIASHGHMHQLVYDQRPQQFREDLDLSIKRLEDISASKVKYFRAPGFSINKDCVWAFDVLAEYEIEVDCSVFPAHRAHGGFPSYTKPIPSIIKHNSITLKELPINYVRVFGKPVTYSGGGYFRMFPYSLIKRWTMRSDYVMSYLHPRDFDPNQPVINDLSLIRRFKSYVGLKSTERKLQQWLHDFDFIDIGSAVKRIDWDKVPVVDLST